MLRSIANFLVKFHIIGTYQRQEQYILFFGKKNSCTSDRKSRKVYLEFFQIVKNFSKLFQILCKINRKRREAKKAALMLLNIFLLSVVIR